MSPIPLGILASAGGAPIFWFSLLGGAADETGYSVAINGTSGVYIAGRSSSSGAGGYDGFLAKYDANGAIAWQRSLGGSNADEAYSVKVASNGDVYISGITNSIGTDGTFFIAKFNSSGTLQWQRALTGAGVESGGYLAIDSSNNIYFAGRSNTSPAIGYDIYLAKYDTSGNLVWQRTFGNSTWEDLGVGAITTNSSGSVIIHAQGNVSSYGRIVNHVLVVNSSGTLTFGEAFSANGAATTYGVAVDSSNNIFFVSYNATTRAVLVKYTSTPAMEWYRVFSASGMRAYAVTTDPAGNVYTAMDQGVDILIAKFNSSGTLQWQRNLYSAEYDYVRSIAHDGNGSLYVFGSTDGTSSGNFSFFLAKLPDDGTKTGSYNIGGFNYIYNAGGYSLNNDGIASSGLSFTTGTGTLTSAAGTLTAGTPSLTATYRLIG